MDNTFFMDFTIADRFGIAAIEDTYKRAVRAWKNDYEYLTELVITLNHKIWEHYEKGNQSYAELYDELWRKADNYAMENLKGKELEYFFRKTD